MNSTKTAIMAMIVAFVAMIGMTGLAMAGSTDVVYTGDGSYSMNYNGGGTGSFGVHTYTSYGDDHMEATFYDTNIAGSQKMNTGSTWTKVTRDATVGTGGLGQDASGTIETSTNSIDTGNGHYIYTRSTYADNEAWTSHVTLNQNVKMIDNGPNEALCGNTRISGFAYGDDTLVSGFVEAGVGGVSVPAYVVSAYVGVEEGSFNMNMRPIAKDNAASYLDRAKLRAIQIGASGIGVAEFYGDGDKVKYDLTITADTGTVHTHSTAHGPDVYIPSTFDNGYYATGYIYALEV